jgi:hypothetical protein
MADGMAKTTDPIVDLLRELQSNVDAVCAELLDRPDLVEAIRVHTSWIPPRDQLDRGVLPPAKIIVRRLGPLLYDALDEGLVEPHDFDALMIERSRAERVLDGYES